MPALSAAAVFLTISSCTKTIGLDPLPGNKILEYKVTNLADTVLYGIIDDTDNTITVYAPFYYGLSVIDPEIKLSEGATLREEILPVSVNDSTETYTVKGSDGLTNSYKLKIIQQNPPVLNLKWVRTPVTAYPLNSIPVIEGNFLSTNASLAKVTLVQSKTGGQTILNTSAAGIAINAGALNSYTFSGAFIPGSIDTGYYKVRVEFLQKTVELPEQVHIIYQQPDVSVLTRQVKQGDELRYTNLPGKMLLGLKSAKATINGTVFNFPVKSYTYEEMVLTVPDTMPPGAYFATFAFEFEGWRTVTKFGSLTILPK